MLALDAMFALKVCDGDTKWEEIQVDMGATPADDGKCWCAKVDVEKEEEEEEEEAVEEDGEYVEFRIRLSFALKWRRWCLLRSSSRL